MDYGLYYKGKHKYMRKYFTKLDWNNMLRSKTAIGSWDILKYEMRISLKKQGLFCRTRKDEDYTNYKEALNVATTEIKKI